MFSQKTYTMYSHAKAAPQSEAKIWEAYSVNVIHINKDPHLAQKYSFKE